jgi:ribosome recycling factor
MIEELKKDAAQRMKKSVDALKDALGKLRTGRAHTSLVDHLRVDYYGNQVPLTQVASVTTPDARTIAIQPWEKPMVGVIEKAILASDLGLTPTTAGQLIRIPLPPLTEERRKEIIKVAKQETEHARVAIRSVRRDASEALKKALKDKKLTEDAERRALDEVQKLTDRHIAEADAVLAAKEKELMEI